MGQARMTTEEWLARELAKAPSGLTDEQRACYEAIVREVRQRKRSARVDVDSRGLEATA